MYVFKDIPFVIQCLEILIENDGLKMRTSVMTQIHGLAASPSNDVCRRGHI